MSSYNTLQGKLELKDGTTIIGTSFGSRTAIAGEVVFNTGLVGYTEALTDPSYRGQILVLTYPLIGNYGVPADNTDELTKLFESEKIQVSGLIVSEVSENYSHWNAASSLSFWLKKYRIPALSNIDTRSLTKKLREHGTILGKISCGDSRTFFFDPDRFNLAQEVSCKEPIEYGSADKTVVLVDCGCKNNIIHSLTRRGVKVIRVPWNYDFTTIDYDGLFISNGPGNPERCTTTIANLEKALQREKPIFGICLGNQLLALAAGAKTFKLKYGHRSQNQPCLELGTNRCYITSQNHGYAIDEKSIPAGWKTWFKNANDGTVEGLKHESKPFMSVQFHPEAKPGPTDTAHLFDEFVKLINSPSLEGGVVEEGNKPAHPELVKEGNKPAHPELVEG